MKYTAIGVVTIGSLIAIMWFLQQDVSVEESIGERIVEIEEATSGADLADSPVAVEDPVTVLPPATEADTTSAANLSESDSESSDNTIRVVPVVQILRSRGIPVPPELLREEEQFADESVDPDWAYGAESELLTRLSQVPNLSANALQVECKSTKCRIHLTSWPGSSNPPFSSIIDSIGLEPNARMSIIDDAGALQSIAYLWREGMESGQTPAPAPGTN